MPASASSLSALLPASPANLEPLSAAEDRTVLAVDGKTLRGSIGLDGQPTKLMCVYDHAHRLVLTQTAVVAGDEITAFSAALATLPFSTNVLVTADALHCQRAHA